MPNHDRAIETLRMTKQKLERLTEWVDAQLGGITAPPAPCPECGGQRLRLAQNPDGRDYYIACRDCSYYSPDHATPAGAWAEHERWCEEMRDE